MKRKKLNSKNPKYLNQTEIKEVQYNKTLLRTLENGVKIYTCKIKA